MDLKAFYAEWAKWFAQPDEVKAKRLRRRADQPCENCGGFWNGKRLVYGRGAVSGDDFTPWLQCEPCGGFGFLPAGGNWYPAGSEAPGYGAKDTHKEYVHLKWADVQPGAWAESSREVWIGAWDQAHEWLKTRDLWAVQAALRIEDQVLRVLHYLPHPTGEVGAAHKDYDLLTVNLPGTAPGLERAVSHYAPMGRSFTTWVPEEEGIHVGEMLEIYTAAEKEQTDGQARFDGRTYLPADLHRVRTAPNTDRLKAVFFVLPPMDFVLRPGESNEAWGGSDTRPPFTAHDYLLGPNGVLNRASPGVKR